MRLWAYAVASALSVALLLCGCGDESIGGLGSDGIPRDQLSAADANTNANASRNTDSANANDAPGVGDAEEHPPLEGIESQDPSGRGPTGQWPPGFPAYRTPAEVFTNSNSSLLSAINSSACSDGCVIEHAANFSSFLKLERTSGTGEIVIRPPIGRRGDYAITGGIDISGSNMVVAGFMHNGGHMFVVKGTNSGFAWSDTTNSAGVLGVEGYKGVRAEGFFYEVIERNMFNGSDRFYARYGGGGHTESLLVGCILTGGTAAPPAHSDTIQIASDGTGGSGFVTVRDSVLWPSWDKVLQGEGSTYQFDLDNTWVVSPTKATSLWNSIGPGTINFTQPYHTTGRSTYSNSTLVGDCFAERVNVTASDLYQSGQCISDGGNTNLGAAEYPPPVPTDAQLDQIWSP